MSTSDLLVARDLVVRQLGTALTQAEKGRGRLVVLSGEAGIGKSALIKWLSSEASARGAHIVLGRAWEFGEAPPFFPFGPAFADLGVDPVEAALAPTAFRIWERLVPGLARAAAEHPVVWIFEDIHAADIGTLDLLALLAQPLTVLKALVVVTARLTDPRVDDRVAQRLTRLMRDGDDIRLEALGVQEVAVLVESLLGRPLSKSQLQQLWERTGGNPLFVTECARMLDTRGVAALRNVPDTIRQVVLERVELLPQRTQQALSALAILGREAKVAPLAAILGELPARVIDDLEPARRAGIIDEVRPGLFSFGHILVRDAIEAALPVAKRCDLHSAAARVLAPQADDPELPEVIVERARHALSSLSPDLGAIELGLRAVALLEQRGAWDRAHAMYQRIDDARQNGVGGGATPLERLHQARVTLLAGKYTEARQICLRVAQIAEQARDPVLLAHAALTFGSEIQPGIIDSDLVRLLERARCELPAEEAALSARVLARLAAALQPAPDPQAPVAMARVALERLPADADEATRIEVLLLVGAAWVDYAPLGERIRLNEELSRLASARGDWATAARAQSRLAIDHLELGKVTEWDAAVTRAIEFAERVATPRQRWRALLLESMRALARGDVVTSDRCLHEARRLEPVADDPALKLALVAHSAAAARLLRRDPLRQEIDVDGLPPGVVDSSVFGAVFQAAALARHGQLEPARAVMVRAGERVQELEAGAFAALLGEVYAALGMTADCRRVRGKLAAEEAIHLTGGHIQLTYEGPKSRAIGLLDLALGEFEAAERELRQAIALVTGFGFTPWVAEIHCDLGRLLKRMGRQDEAAFEFASAERCARELRFSGLLETIGQEVQALTSQPVPEPNETKPSFSLECEGDTWRVGFAGRTLRVKDSRGVQLLARLVEHRGEEIHVLALASDDPSSSLQEGTAFEGLDQKAKRAYRERLDELASDIREAEHDNDLGRLERLKREQAALETELARGLGLGGKSRAAASPSERARVNVQRRLKDAIARLAELDADCGEFLERYVRTGNYCVFLG
ncbi:MAG TPA: AAA family ATPase [Polyangiaceae bacterium]|jgi:tetratricopeptide (TPR) repeat protein|nr:AAA family ATPase [Polyangiaceae bacterium]